MHGCSTVVEVLVYGHVIPYAVICWHPSLPFLDVSLSIDDDDDVVFRSLSIWFPLSDDTDVFVVYVLCI